MLQIKDIKKEYSTHGLLQKALDGVSLNFRRNEFVAILGPSGSGKTTLLNVIGGLDRYDSGDLIINGVSTKKYKDRDWDSYRNHTIGFVFQSYNLIPHQTVLQNVELALTISGIDKEERRRKAKEVLKEVGLEDHINKIPNQLSGGQMQRVAIARALVNDPDILLADEPTGALDSATGVQVMELLKKVAANHLVIMVTHNPELADNYANRIVKLRDGKVISDTKPHALDEETIEPIHKNLGKASMGFLTALSLSFNNLRTKLTRTLLVAFAGSIGIIGIAMILALSTGVNKYIDDIEKDTVRKYPLTIDKTGFDLSSMISFEAGNVDKSGKGKKKAEVKEAQTITNMFSSMNSNDLSYLKKHIDSGKSGIQKYSRAIEYSYPIEPRIYAKTNNKYRQVNPDQTRQKMGFSFTQTGVYSQMVSSNVFHCLPEDKSLYMDEYKVEAGRWPKKSNECVVVLYHDGSVTDLALYAMGLKDYKELDKMLDKFAKGKTVRVKKSAGTFTYKDLMSVKFKMINNTDCYSYDYGNKVWVDHSKDNEFMKGIIDKGKDVNVVGVVRPKSGQQFTVLMGDIYYPSSMTKELMKAAQKSDIVKDQKKNKKKNVLTGKAFGKEDNAPDLGKMFSIDGNAMKEAFKFDTSQLKKGMAAPSPNVANISSMISPKDISMLMPQMKNEDIERIINSANFSITEPEMQVLFNKLTADFLKYYAEKGTDYTKLRESFSQYLESDEGKKIIADNLKTSIMEQLGEVLSPQGMKEDYKDILSGFPKFLQTYLAEHPGDFNGAVENFLSSEEVNNKINAKLNKLNNKLGNITISSSQADKMAEQLLEGYSKYAKEKGLPDAKNILKDYTAYINTERAQNIIKKEISKNIDYSGVEKEIARSMNIYSSKAISAMTGKVMQGIMTNYMKNMGKGIDFSKIFRVDTDAFAKAMNMNLNENDIRAFMQSLMNTEGNTYDSNLMAFGYAEENEPSTISIYAKDFDSKGEIKTLLDKYNSDMKKSGDKEKVITYSDLVGTLMGSVSDIINAISYILIAFVSISLVVSSIMIGVITYISVLERRKEIGILRAIGASKRNVARVFKAETFIIGSLAGLLGIGITELLIIPTNIIIDMVTSADMVAVLPAKPAIYLIILSISLTLIGGLLPSRKAAKSDPVKALRVE